MSPPVQFPCKNCLSQELCAVDGCRKRPAQGLVPAMPPREPIDLDYQPGKIMRGLMRLTDLGSEVVRRGPAPFAPQPEEPVPVSATVPPAPSKPPETMRDVIGSVNLSASPAPPPRPAPAATGAISEIRARRVGRGWLVYADGAEVDVALDSELGATIGRLAVR